MNTKPETGSPPAVPASAVRGGGLMSLAMLGFVLNDTIAKTLAGTMNVGQFIAIRGLFASIIIAAAGGDDGQVARHSQVAEPAGADPHRVRRDLDLPVHPRLFHMPLPNITAILQAVPLVVTLMAAAFLGEAVGWKRLSAILAGFAGVLLIVKPGGEGFNTYTLLAIACVFTVAIRDLFTRKLDSSTPSIIVAFANAVCVMIGGIIWMAFDGVEPVSTENLARIALGSVFLVAGYLLTVISLRDTEVAYTAPFRYTLIVYALILGYVVFGDVPDAWSLAGIVLIVGSGLFTLYREQQLKRRIGFGRRLIR
jgi:drug/metabolite transporter (DMT)-like permease